MKTTFFVVLFLAFNWMQAQTVQVNPDGTHTVIHEGETTTVEVNPDGTHSVIHHNKENSVRVNPDGTHTILPKKEKAKKKKTKK